AREYRLKHIPSACVDHENARLCQGLIRWTTTLPFEQIGRIVVMPGRTLEHRDYRLEQGGRGDDFVWCQIGCKNFFVKLGETRHYIPPSTTLAWFHSDRVHGSDKPEPGAFSLRIDGIFTAAFRSRLDKLVGFHGQLPESTADRR